jgi:glutamate racemase
VEAVERCEIDTIEVRALLARYIDPMLAAGVDTLVLGCTHYPFLDASIREIAGERLALVDTSVAIARQLERVLEANGLSAPAADRQPAAPRLCSTDEGRHMHQLASTLLGLDTPVEQVSITAPDRSHAA